MNRPGADELPLPRRINFEIPMIARSLEIMWLYNSRYQIIFIFLRLVVSGSDSDLDRTYLHYVEERDHDDDRLGDLYDQNYNNQWNTAKLWAKVCHRTQRTRL